MLEKLFDFILFNNIDTIINILVIINIFSFIFIVYIIYNLYNNMDFCVWELNRVICNIENFLDDFSTNKLNNAIILIIINETKNSLKSIELKLLKETDIYILIILSVIFIVSYLLLPANTNIFKNIILYIYWVVVSGFGLVYFVGLLLLWLSIEFYVYCEYVLYIKDNAITDSDLEEIENLDYYNSVNWVDSIKVKHLRTLLKNVFTGYYYILFFKTFI